MFEAEAEYWLDELSLHNWTVIGERIPADECAFADCDWDYYNRCARIRLALRCIFVDPKELVFRVHESAFHEICEILLAELRANSRYARSETDESVHEVIRRLEHAVFRPDYHRRHGLCTEQTPFGLARVVSPDKITMSQGEKK